MSQPEYLTSCVPEEMAGLRLDQALVRLFPAYSRGRMQQWIRDGHVSVEGKKLRAKDKVHSGERIHLTVMLEEEVCWHAEPLQLNIVYEDAALLVLNKPAGQVVHPAAGNRAGTLVNALLHHDPELAKIPRAGIVHRLDKDTSGLLVVARTLKAQKRLVEQLQAREVKREYQAIVMGRMISGGRIDAPIGRHAVARKRMTVRADGKAAVSHYRVVERFGAHTLVKVNLETGRTHQIRVHMAHGGFPIVGDKVYGGRTRIPAGCSESLAGSLRSFTRQALHAARLGLTHPDSGEWMEWSAPLPDDMARLLEVLREDAHRDD